MENSLKSQWQVLRAQGNNGKLLFFLFDQQSHTLKYSTCIDIMESRAATNNNFLSQLISWLIDQSLGLKNV